jgi:hypothetical protein
MAQSYCKRHLLSLDIVICGFISLTSFWAVEQMMILFIVPGWIIDQVSLISFKKTIDFKLRKIMMSNLYVGIISECIHDYLL